MARTILVLSERPEAAAGLLVAAEHLADVVGGCEVNVLAVCRPVSIPILAMTDGKFTKNEIDQFMSEEQRRLTALGASYERWAGRIAGKPITTHRLMGEGDTIAVVKAHGVGADFIVAARPSPDDDAETRAMFRAAIFETNRPVLVVPSVPQVPFGRRVGVAWREDKHARQSTLAALPVLAGAEQLHVFAGVRERQSQPVLPEALADRERAPELHVIALGGRPLGETLLARSQALGVDLLVMGAYYHSPLREQIFGGVTRYMLTHAGIPLLMFH